MQRPVRTGYDRAADVICIILLLGVSVWIALCWNSFPEQVALHYNAAGEIDKWGDRITLIILPVIAWLIYGLLAVVGYFPKMWNMPIRITDENRERVFRTTAHFVSILKCAVTVFFLIITVCAAYAINMPLWLAVTLICAIVFAVIGFIARLIRIK